MTEQLTLNVQEFQLSSLMGMGVGGLEGGDCSYQKKKESETR